MDIEQLHKFNERFNIIGECWIWIGASNGSIRYGGFHYKGVLTRAHHFSYKLFIGEIPIGMEIMHTCDIGRCVNPNHLVAGTHADNMRDMVVKNRQHKFLSDDDVRAIRADKTTSSFSLGIRYRVTIQYINRILR